MTRTPGKRNDPYAGFNFFVEIEGLVAGGFCEVRGLAVETEVEEYREGGVNEYVHQLPGPTRHPARLTLRRGLSDADTLWGWHQDVARGTIERKNGTVYLLDAQGATVMGWNFREAYPVKWTGPELCADANTVAVESVELVHRGLSKQAVS